MRLALQQKLVLPIFELPWVYCRFLEKFFIAAFLLLVHSLYANDDLIEKAKIAKDKANIAFSQTDYGPERHRALIAAYWVNQGDCVLDLGAYKGSFSLFYRQLVGQDGLVIAYEACPPIYEYLVNRLQSLSVTNVIPKNRAISDSTNKSIPMKIYHNNLNSEGSTVEPLLMNPERMPGNTAIVQVLTEKVDDLLEDNTLPFVRFIKIDTEGHEHAVIRGAQRLLLKQRPLVIFEYGFQKGFWEPDTIQQMEELGYVCYDCNTDERVRPDYGILAVPYVLTDLLAIPVEFEKEVTALLPYLH